jgi:aspartate carbamoyltransferase catalytic subunit
MKSILNCKQFSREDIETLFEITDDIKLNPLKYQKSLADKVIAIIFYEPSTRTRMSFQSAALRLGAKVILTENALDNSSVSKGESFNDTMRIIEAYSDLIVVRINDETALNKLPSVMSVPVVNAGTGMGEHPTQALLDLYTMKNVKGRIDNLKILFSGDLKYGRTSHSLIELLGVCRQIKIYCYSDDNLKLPHEYVEFAESRGIEVNLVNSFDEISKDIDFIYSTRIQHERIKTKDTFNELIIDGDRMKYFSQSTYVMHPLPRNNEIDCLFDFDKRAIYFEQAKNGLYVRMAVLYNIFKTEGDRNSEN